jgi:hypothetical protein
MGSNNVPVIRVFVIIAAIIIVANTFGCTRRMQEPSHSEAVRDALIRLLTRPSGAFLIIEEPQSGKFIQFAGSRDELLLLDLPSQTLSPDEMMKARAVFAELGYPGPETYQTQEYPGGPPTGEQTSFNVNFGTDIYKAVELTVAVLQRVYSLDENAPLQLTEE